MGRLVIIHGVCCGVGQSTLCRRLAASIPGAEVLWEDELSQPAIFTRPEFADVADRFHRRNASPDAGVGHPPAALLEAAYSALTRSALQGSDVMLMGWSPMDLAEDLDWARADEPALHDHLRTVRELLGPLEPVLVILDGDIEVAVDRAAEQRGRDWFPGGDAIDDDLWPHRRQALIAEAVAVAARVQRGLDAAGWTPTVVVDGTALSEDEVFTTVSTVLRRQGIEVRSE